MLSRIGIKRRIVSAALALALVLITGMSTAGLSPVAAASAGSGPAQGIVSGAAGTMVPLADSSPDLIIQDITLSPEIPSAGSPTSIVFAVKNQGAGQAGYSYVACYVDDILIESHQINPVAAGATVTTTFAWTAQAGVHTIRAVADANSQVDESVETNNSKTFTASVPAPDLFIQSISWTPENPSRGDSITFTVAIKNQGTIECSYFRVNLYIDGASRGYQDVGTVGAGATVTRTYTWAALSGQHSIKATVDDDNRIKETDETNNERTVTFTTLPSDLVVQDIRWTPENPSKNDIVTFTVTIKNQGTGRADGYHVACYIDEAFVTSVFANPLESGSSANVTFNWTAAANSHNIRIIADFYEQVAESDETNNEGTATFMTMVPDLVVQALTWSPLDVAVGDNVTFSVTIKNQGGGRAETCRALCSVGERYVCYLYFPAMNAGTDITQTFNWKAEVGSYTVSVIIDYDKEINETSESNNTETANFYVTPPDLTVQDVIWSPESPAVGEKVTFTITIKNQGSGIADEFRVVYFIDDAILTTDFFNQMASGATYQRELTWEAQKGAHTFKVIADFNTLVTESNEDNNEYSVTVVTIMPDLIIDNIAWSPADYSEGDRVTFTATIKNQGSTQASPFRVAYYVDGLVVGNQDFGQVDPSTVVTGSFSWIALSGAHIIEIAADTSNQVDESDENNNTRTLNTPPPDLVVQDITWSPAEPSIGDNVSVSFVIKNRGNGKADKSQAAYYVDGSPAVYQDVPGIGAGATATMTFSLIAGVGEHTIRIAADSGNRVIEFDETNNEKTAQFTSLLSDLIIDDIRWSIEDPSRRGEITLTITIKNQGRAGTAGSEVICYLDGTAAGTQDVPEIGSGATVTRTFTVSAEVGRHTVRAVADASDMVIETDETNNEKSIELSNLPSQNLSPDLVIQNIAWWPTDASPGDTVTFAVRLKNQGDEKAVNPRLDLYIDGASVGYCDVGDVAVGAVVTKEFTWTAEAGSHEISTFIDLDEMVLESDESNNAGYLTLSLKAPPVTTTTTQAPIRLIPTTLAGATTTKSLLEEWWWPIFAAMVACGGLAIFVAVRAYRSRT